MFAKGKQPGGGCKDEVLKHIPDAVCHRKTALGITGYLVTKGKGGDVIAVATTATEAWGIALAKIEYNQEGQEVGL